MFFAARLRASSRRIRITVAAGAIVALAATATGIAVNSGGATSSADRSAAAVVAAQVGNGSRGRSAATTSSRRVPKPLKASDTAEPASPTTGSDPSPAGPGPRPADFAGVRWTSGSMQVGALRRAWWLATPEHTTHRKVPLLMIMHGRGSTPAIEAARTGFLGVVAAGDAIAVYPAGYDNSWNAGRCCGKANAANIDDLTFLHQLVTTLQARPDVATDDLDLIGFSNGAKMAFDLVCSGTLVPRAMAVAEAVPTTDCSRAPAVPLVQVAGTADPLVPYATPDPKLTAGGVPLTSVLSEVAAWAANNGCTASTSTEQGDRTLQTWTGGKAPVALLTYPGGVHAWQSGATPYLWQFLQNESDPIT